MDGKAAKMSGKPEDLPVHIAEGILNYALMPRG